MYLKCLGRCDPLLAKNSASWLSFSPLRLLLLQDIAFYICYSQFSCEECKALRGSLKDLKHLKPGKASLPRAAGALVSQSGECPGALPVVPVP